MKKRIQIMVQPVDNGYTINCTSNDHPTGQNAKSANLIAENDEQVAATINAFVQETFNPTSTGTAAV